MKVLSHMILTGVTNAIFYNFCFIDIACEYEYDLPSCF